MSILCDTEIRDLIFNKKMVIPWAEQTIEVGGNKVISFGISSYGYDMRISDEFHSLSRISPWIIDPKDLKGEYISKTVGDSFVIPPNSFVLARSFEYFRIPRNILTLCVGKSTYARCGIIINVTHFEPEWEGYATLEISNTTPIPAKIYANEGIAQVIFFKGDKEPDISYADKAGKYQKQEKVEYSKV